MSKMRAALITRPGGPIELVERPVPEPGPGWVRVEVQACGICHSDSLVKTLDFKRQRGVWGLPTIQAAGCGSR